MARYAIVNAGRVVNIAEGDAAWAQMVGAVADDGTAVIGGTYAAGVFGPAPVTAMVPGAVTMRQARLALLAAGKLAAVQMAIDALPHPARDAAQIAWEYSSEVERNFGLVAQLGPALNLQPVDIDALFVAAAKL